jgi:iron complex outermembrane receptor protein
MKKKLIISGIAAQLMVPQGLQAETLALEEVIVTAEKREQSLQEVPASISAFSSSQIEQAGWDDISQLETSIPSVSMGGDGDSRPFVFIRGVGSRKFDIGSEGSVGVFVDEIYNARFSSALSGIVDIERIEVLKGPQGTLYGRNTIGGAVSLYSVKPTDEFEARVKVAFGNEGYQRIGGYVSGALSDDWVGRISASVREDDGNMYEVLSGKNDGQEADAVRLNLLGQLSDKTSLEFTAQSATLDQSARLAQANGEMHPVFGFYQLGHAIPLPVLPEPLKANIMASIKAGTVANILQEAALDPRNVRLDRPGFSNLETDLVSLKIEHESDNFLFTSITSRTSDDLHEQTDFESTTRNAIWTDVVQDSRQVTQEFRFTSVDGGMFTLDDRLTWVVGLYYFNDKGYRKDDYSVEEQGNIPPQYYQAASVDFSQARQDVTLDNKSFALYGQATLALTDQLNLTLGIRRSEDEKDVITQMITNTPGYPFVAAPFTLPQTLEYSSTDPKLSIDYAINENAMAYITFASGYKSGGAQFASWAQALNVGGFDKEQLDSLEIGYKARLLDNRLQLNMAAYRYDYTDQQVQAIVVVNGSPAGLTSNAAESEMDGFELEMNYLLTNALRVDFNYFNQDAVFGSFEDVSGSKTGNPMQFAPENAYTLALNYSPDFENNLQLRAEYSYKDEFQFDAGNRAISLEPDHSVVNFTASMDLSESMSLRLYCNNCSDELIRTQVTTFATAQGGGGRSIYGPGRRFGAEFTYNF